jgi:hypothetical protein
VRDASPKLSTLKRDASDTPAADGTEEDAPL